MTTLRSAYVGAVGWLTFEPLSSVPQALSLVVLLLSWVSHWGHSLSFWLL